MLAQLVHQTVFPHKRVESGDETSAHLAVSTEQVLVQASKGCSCKLILQGSMAAHVITSFTLHYPTCITNYHLPNSSGYCLVEGGACYLHIVTGPVSLVSTEPLFPYSWLAWHRQIGPMLGKRPWHAHSMVICCNIILRWLQTVRKTESSNNFLFF